MPLADMISFLNHLPLLESLHLSEMSTVMDSMLFALTATNPDSVAPPLSRLHLVTLSDTRNLDFGYEAIQMFIENRRKVKEQEYRHEPLRIRIAKLRWDHKAGDFLSEAVMQLGV
jgi:hypothetical protein